MTEAEHIRKMTHNTVQIRLTNKTSLICQAPTYALAVASTYTAPYSTIGKKH